MAREAALNKPGRTERIWLAKRLLNAPSQAGHMVREAGLNKPGRTERIWLAKRLLKLEGRQGIWFAKRLLTSQGARSAYGSRSGS